MFGIRNVTDIPAALREARRVLKRGGRFYCMEFSSSDWPGFSNLYEAWANNVIPKVGKIVTDDEESYRYLVESIRRFPKPAAFRAMVAQAGFVRADGRPDAWRLGDHSFGLEDMTNAVRRTPAKAGIQPESGRPQERRRATASPTVASGKWCRTLARHGALEGSGTIR